MGYIEAMRSNLKETTNMDQATLVISDGGHEARSKGTRDGDCVPRALAHLGRWTGAFGSDDPGVCYDRMDQACRQVGKTGKLRRLNHHVYEPILKDWGFDIDYKMPVGDRQEVGLPANPHGATVADIAASKLTAMVVCHGTPEWADRPSLHATVVKDGVIYDTFDCSDWEAGDVYFVDPRKAA